MLESLANSELLEPTRVGLECPALSARASCSRRGGGATRLSLFEETVPMNCIFVIQQCSSFRMHIRFPYPVVLSGGAAGHPSCRKPFLGFLRNNAVLMNPNLPMGVFVSPMCMHSRPSPPFACRPGRLSGLLCFAHGVCQDDTQWLLGSCSFSVRYISRQ